MALIFYFGNDHQTLDFIKRYIDKRRTESAEENSIYEFQEFEKLDESLDTLQPNQMWLEDSFFSAGFTLEDWLKKHIAKYPSLKCKRIILSENTSEIRIRKLLQVGFDDYLLLPSDIALIFERLWIHQSGSLPGADVRQVHTLQMESQSELGEQVVLLELGEFSAKVRVPREPDLQKIYGLYSDYFHEEMAEPQKILARPLAVEKDPKEKNHFILTLVFIAPSQGVIKNIRNALRRTYIRSKR